MNRIESLLCQTDLSVVDLARTGSQSPQLDQLLVLPDIEWDWQSEGTVASELRQLTAEGVRTGVAWRRRESTAWAFWRRLIRSMPLCRSVTIRPTFSSVRNAALVAGLSRFFGLDICVDLRSPLTASRLRLTRWEMRALGQAGRILVADQMSAMALAGYGLNSQVAPAVEPIYKGRVIEQLQPRILAPVYNPDVVSLVALVKAFGFTLSKYPRSSLAVLALCSLEDELTRVCAGEGIHEVELIDGANSRAVDEAFAQSDLLLNASLGHEISGAVLRALQSGIPVVTHPSGWAKSLPSGQDALQFVDTGRPGQLSAAICSLVDEPARVRKMSSVGPQIARRYFAA